MANAADSLPPWVARLEVVTDVLPNNAEVVGSCAAVAIAPDWLLTAAHCLEGGQWQQIRVTIGTAHVDDRRALHRAVDYALCFPDYRASDLKHDLALLRLSHPLPPELPLAPLAGWHEDPQFIPGMRAQVVGWPGQPNQGRLGRLARMATMRIEGREAGGVPGGVIVASRLADQGQAVCVGESGGPLIGSLGQGPLVLGLLSAVEGQRDATGGIAASCADPHSLTWFTAVSPYRRWIRTVLDSCNANPSRCN